MRTPPLIPAWLLLLTLAAIIAAVMATAGCASYAGPAYTWRTVRAPAPLPWFYVAVADVHRTCLEAGAKAQVGEIIGGCATWTPTHCTIYLPLDADAWVISHEERHCNGEEH